MRYLLFSYYTKPNGQIDEVMTIAKRLKTKDWQMSKLILDFKEQRVLLCNLTDNTDNKDWDTIVSYYYKYYANTIERLFVENGHTLPPGE
jgi:hypothetical protein